MSLIYFSHGKESGPNATKIRVMETVAREKGLTTVSIDYRGIESPQARVAKLLESVVCQGESLILVGSSMGAYVSIAASRQLQDRGQPVKGLFLLAPAVYMQGYGHYGYSASAQFIKVIHGWHDEIVPADNAIRFAREHSAPLLLLNDTHRLGQSINIIQQQFENFLQEVCSA